MILLWNSGSFVRREDLDGTEVTYDGQKSFGHRFGCLSASGRSHVKREWTSMAKRMWLKPMDVGISVFRSMQIWRRGEKA